MSSSPKSTRQTAQPAQAAAPPQTQLQTEGWGGMGYTMPQDPGSMGTAQTGIGTQAPEWMTGNFAAPWWGQQAPNVGAAMQQQQDPAAYQAMLQAQAARAIAPTPEQSLMPTAAQVPGRGQGGGFAGANNFYTAGPENAHYAREMQRSGLGGGPNISGLFPNIFGLFPNMQQGYGQPRVYGQPQGYGQQQVYGQPQPYADWNV